MFERLIYVVPAILIAITIHEFSHALVAYRLGDPTAKSLGRITLNPLKHLDPMGTVMILFTAMAGFGIGWGKPVPVNPYYLRIGAKTGMALVSVAGPASNFLTAFLLVQGIRAGWIPYGVGPSDAFLEAGIWISIWLGVFNLLPLPPLDGFKVVLGVLPGAAARSFAQLENFGPALLLTILMADWVFGFGILFRLLTPLRMVAETIIFATLF